MADRLTLAHAIEDAGIERTKAEALAGAIFDAVHDNVATKVDIKELRAETKADIQELRSDLKADIQELRSELKADIQELRSELKADIQELRGETKADIQELRAETKGDIQELRSEMALLRADMALLEHRLLTRLGGLIVVLVGLLFAALHAWPPGHG